MKSNLLVEAYRGEVQEKHFYGWISVVNSSGKIIRSLQHEDSRCYMRSCEKPLQALCSKQLGAVDKYNFTTEEIAISFSSHAGSKEHVELLKGILKKLNLTEEVLKCGTHPPVDKTERHRLIKEGLFPTVLHNNCSAKHLFIIASCLSQGWDITNYIDLNHPVQSHINGIVEQYCLTKDYKIGIDGCSMPIHAMNLSNMGAGFAKYFDGTTEHAETIADAVGKYPHIAGGYGRIDTSIIQSSQGKLISKVGAEGLLITTPRHSGEALVVKMASGDDYMRNFVVVEALKQLGWITSSPMDDPYLTKFADLNLYNHARRKIGFYKFKFAL